MPATLLLLALALPQTTVDIAVTGTVSGMGSTLTNPALASVGAGDPAEFRFQVDTPGNSGGAGQFEVFDVVPSSIELEVGGVLLAGGSSPAGCFLFDRPPGGLGDILTANFDMVSGETVAMTFNDPSSSAWSSLDMTQNFGTYPASAFVATLLIVNDPPGALTFDVQTLRIGPPAPSLGSSFCVANANSTGALGTLTATGSSTVSDNDVTLNASSLPPNVFGLFVTSLTIGAPVQPPGSSGALCLSGTIGRYIGPGQILNAGAGGSFSLGLDLTRTPQSSGFVAIMAGETWRFQAWHRDFAGGLGTSNFTEGLAITFQ